MPRERRFLFRKLTFAAALVAGAFALQFTTAHLGSIDGYFHIRYSEILRKQFWSDVTPKFPWLPFTILSEDRYFDHHMLFHWWLALFAHGDLVWGAKVASAIGAAAALLGCYGFLLWRRVRGSEWWTLALLAAAPGFLYRIEMPRVQAWSLLCLIAALALLIRHRAHWLFALAWFYTWLYDAFPLLLAMCACAVAARYLIECELAWRIIALPAAGVIAGLIVNPYFPHNVRFVFHHYRAKLDPAVAIPVGAEWSAPLFAQWTGWAGLIALLVAVGTLTYIRRHYLDVPKLTTILIACFFWILLWCSSRFIEYAVPFTAFALTASLDGRVADWLCKLSLRARHGLAAALLVWLAITTVAAAVQLRGRPPVTRYADASQWIRKHTEPGEIVFNAGWDDFPFLHFHNPANRYVTGLDPTYLAERDRERYELWYNVSAGYVSQPAATIRERFAARVAITDRLHEAFIRRMDEDPLARRTYEDADSVVYAIGF